MPHRRVAPFGSARRLVSRAVGLPLLVALACSRSGDSTLTVVLDFNHVRGEREVIALPVDPAVLFGGASAAVTAPPARKDSLARLAVLRDSADVAESTFQEERDALNTEAQALDGIDRRTKDYAQRFDSFRRRSTAARSLRATRDRLRKRLGTLVSRQADGSAVLSRQQSTLRATFDTLSVMGRKTVIHRGDGDTVRLSLADADWWIGVAAKDSVPIEWTRIHTPHAGVIKLSHKR